MWDVLSSGRRERAEEEITRREEPLTEFEAEAQSQLVLLDLSVSVDVAVTHQGVSELVQVGSTDAGLEDRVRRTGSGGLKQGQKHISLLMCFPSKTHPICSYRLNPSSCWFLFQ